MGYIIELTEDQIKNISEYENLLFNMSAGVLPEYLSKNEIEMLRLKHGENWFEELGYSEPEYKKPIFE